MGGRSERPNFLSIGCSCASGGARCSEGAWIKAGDLKPGMKLRTPSGDTVELTANRHFDKRQRTHDLTITGIHAYYVLADSTPLLVHNCDDDADLPGGDTPGEARVYLDPVERHATIKVEAGGDSLHTEQVITGDTTTGAVRVEGHSPTTIAVRIQLPRANLAMSYQEVTMGPNLGAYDLGTNSCVTYCARVLRAGGVTDIPIDSTKDATGWLLRHHG